MISLGKPVLPLLSDDMTIILLIQILRSIHFCRSMQYREDTWILLESTRPAWANIIDDDIASLTVTPNTLSNNMIFVKIICWNFCRGRQWIKIPQIILPLKKVFAFFSKKITSYI